MNSELARNLWHPPRGMCSGHPSSHQISRPCGPLTPADCANFMLPKALTWAKSHDGYCRIARLSVLAWFFLFLPAKPSNLLRISCHCQTH